MTAKKSKHQIDVTAEICPITFVKVKLRLEELEAGEILGVYLKDGEAVRMCPAAFAWRAIKSTPSSPRGRGFTCCRWRRGNKWCIG